MTPGPLIGALRPTPSPRRLVASLIPSRPLLRYCSLLRHPAPPFPAPRPLYPVGAVYRVPPLLPFFVALGFLSASPPPMSHVSTTHSPLFQNSGCRFRAAHRHTVTAHSAYKTLVDVSLSSLHGSGRPQRLPLARRAGSSASSASSADAELAASSVELAASSAELAASSLGPPPRSGLPPRSARTRALLARTGPG